MIAFPPRRILVAFDRTANSLPAWRRAKELADRFGASIEIIHVLRFEVGSPELYPVMRPSLSDMRALREKIAKAVGGGARVRVVEGVPAACILAAARRSRADLIVMGSHGRRGAERIVLGSVAESVIRRSPVPVYIERGGGGARPVARVLAPVHFASYAKNGFLFAAAFAASLDARLTALHVNPDPIWGGNAVMRLRALVETLPPALGGRCDLKVAAGEDAARAILRAAAGHDVVALVAHRKSALGDAVFGTTAERLLRLSRKPLLIVPHAKRVVAVDGAERCALSV